MDTATCAADAAGANVIAAAKAKADRMDMMRRLELVLRPRDFLPFATEWLWCLWQ